MQVKAIKQGIISVEWDGGKQSVSGFKTKEKAERCIHRVFKVVAPDKNYDIITYYPPGNVQ